MTHHSIRVAKKFVASAVISGLILTAPGLPCYRAMANTIGIGIGQTAARPGMGQAGAVRPMDLGLTARPGGVLSPMDGSALLEGALPGFIRPDVKVSIRQQPAALQGILPVEAVRTAPSAAGPSVMTPVSRVVSAPRALSRSMPVLTPSSKASPKAVSHSSKKAETLSRTRSAVAELGEKHVSPFSFLSRFFDSNSRRSAAASLQAQGSVLGAPSSVSGSLLGRREASAVRESPETPVPAVGRSEKRSRGPSLWLVLPLAAAGAVGAWFAAPYVLAFAAPYLPAVLSAWTAAHPVWTLSLITAAGGLAGIGLSQYQVWLGLPKAAFNASRKAGRNTFRFWARFGRIFDAVLTGRSSDEAMKAPLPVNMFKYPVLAWPFVLIGYGTVPAALALVFTYLGLPLLSLSFILPAVAFAGAPAAYAAGFLYKAAATPVRAVLTGVKQVLIEFFPWLVNVFRFLNRVIRRAVPFVLGYLWGMVQAGGVGIGLGASTLARPYLEHVVAEEYEPQTLPQLAGMRLLQLGGLIGTAVAGIIGGALGLVLSVPYMFSMGFRAAFKSAEIEGRAKDLFDAWFGFMEKEDGLGSLGEYSFKNPRYSYDEVELGTGLMRLLVIPLQNLYMLFVLTGAALTAFVRSWYRAVRLVRTGKEPEKQKEQYYRAPKPGEQKPEPAPEPPAEGKYRLLLPLALGAVGLIAGAAVVYWLLFSIQPVAMASLLAWDVLAEFGLGALAGAVLGLALSQPKAYKGYLSSILKSAKDAGGLAFRSWARLGLNTDAAMRNVPLDEKMEHDPSWNYQDYPGWAQPGVRIGYTASIFMFPAGAVYRSVATPLHAAWLGFMSIAENFLPFLKRAVRFIWNVLRRIIPFIAGMVWGALKGLFFSAAGGAAVLAKPMFERAVAPEDEQGEYKYDTVSQLLAVRAVQGVSVLLGLVAGLFGAVVGLVYGLPFALTFMLAQAFRWARIHGRIGGFFRIWERQTLRQEADKFEPVTELEFPTQPSRISYWDGTVRAGNILTHAAVSPVWGLPAALTAWSKSVGKAARYAAVRDPEKTARDIAYELEAGLKDVPGFRSAYGMERSGLIEISFDTRANLDAALAAGLVAFETAGYKVEFTLEDTGEVVRQDAGPAAKGGVSDEARPEARTEPAEEDLSGKSPLLPLALGLLGGAAAVFAGHVYLLPLLGLTGWYAWAGYAASGLAGIGLGLAVSQPSAYRGWHLSAYDGMKDSLLGAFGMWHSAGLKYAAALKGAETAPKRSVLAWPHTAFGAAMGFVWAFIGLGYGIVVVPVRASLRGLKVVAVRFIPWFKSLMEALWNIAKHFFPFVFGLFAGLVTGVVGTALFGAMLLGRPWFKYVVTEDVDVSTTGKLIGTWLTKLAATVAGVVSGLVGMVVMFVLGAPILYSLMLSLTMAFQLGDVGGKSERFFELWSKGALRTELRRINLLTNRFEFDEERENGAIHIADAWVRMANIFAAVFAAALASTVAGYVSFVRSVVKAVKDVRAGKDIPDDSDYDDMTVVRKSIRKGARNTSKVLSRVLGVGGMLYGAYLVVKSFWAGGFLSAAWHGFLYGSLAWPAGWIAGAVLGIVGGLVVGMIVWLARQLEKAPPEPEKMTAAKAAAPKASEAALPQGSLRSAAPRSRTWTYLLRTGQALIALYAGMKAGDIAYSLLLGNATMGAAAVAAAVVFAALAAAAFLLRRAALKTGRPNTFLSVLAGSAAAVTLGQYIWDLAGLPFGAAAGVLLGLALALYAAGVRAER